MDKSLYEIADDFINLKRQTGYKYIIEAYTIKNLVKACSELNNGIIENDILKSWGKKRDFEKLITFKKRLSDANQFIRYLKTIGFSLNEYHTSIIKDDQSFQPIILTQDEIARFFYEADHIEHRNGSRSDIDYPIMFRILYGCGLRVSELTDLKIKDCDFDNRLLIIHQPKNNIDKLVPFSSSLYAILIEYHRRFNQNVSSDDYFFRSRFNGHYSRRTLNQEFHKLLKKANIPCDTELGPRLHDLRHLFCCLSLKQMIENGDDPYVHLPVLSTYVGHKSTTATERYLHLSQINYEDILTKVTSKYGKVVEDYEE